MKKINNNFNYSIIKEESIIEVIKTRLTLSAIWKPSSKLTSKIVKIMVLSHQMVFFECLLSKSRRPFQFILTFCIRTEKVEQK